MKKVYCILSACMFFIIGNIQADNIKNSFILTYENDTVFGKIDLKTNRNNQENCRFIDANGNEINYSPSDIAGYYFIDENKRYVSKTITVDSIPRKVFLEILVVGMVNLYYYEDYNIKPDDNLSPKQLKKQEYIPYFFFEKEDGTLYSIRKKPDEILFFEDEKKYKAKEDNAYKGIVRYLFSDVSVIAQKTDYIPFDQKTMINIVKDYHYAVCPTGEDCIIYKNPKPDNRGEMLKVSVYGGLQLSQYYWENRHWAYRRANKEWFYDYHITSNWAPVIGIELLLVNPRVTNLAAIQFDISTSYISCNEGGLIVKVKEPYNGQSPEIPNGYEREITNFGSLLLNARLGPVFKYSLGKIEPLLSVGFSQMYVFDNTVKGRHMGVYYNLGANIKVKRNFIILRFNYDSLFVKPSNVTNGNDESRLFSAKLGYMF